MLNLLRSCFPDRQDEWEPKLRELIPTYGGLLNDNAELAESTERASAETLGLPT